MDLNNLERGGLKNLQNFETDFDTDSVWGNIEKKEKRRPIFWLWFSGAAGVFLLSAGLVFYNLEKLDLEIVGSQSIDNQLFVNDSDSVLNLKKVEIIEGISISEDESQTTFLEKEIDETENLKTDKTQLEIAEISKTKNLTPQDASSKIQTDYRSELGNTNIPPSLLIQLKSLENEREFFNQSTEKNEGSADEKADEKSPKIELSKLPMKFAELNFEIKPDFEEFSVEKPVIIPIKKPNFTLSAFAGIGYQFKTLELKDNELNTELLATRKANESLLESLAFGFDFDKNIGKKWSIGTGFEMILHTEKMIALNRRIDNVTDLAPSEVPAQYAGREGFLIRKKDSIYYNQHRLINVPLRVTYFFNYKKLRLAPETTLVFNISQKSSGHLRNEFAVTESVINYFKPRIGLGYRLGCKFSIPTKGKFLLYAKPSFEWNPSDVSSDLNSISQKRNLVRLDLGVSRIF